ncbi:SDR family oxidoreductase [Acetobacter cerevisiae]|uniref:SDR family oxidoreductase n=1 Tax=Acetobacter cerevisiae TaxID=178900 RepID=A0ABT1EV84_9PROT|nr:UDP-glucuronic acid decarboxylase family protein [Acetobacter cerevisiae]MCP1247290.1 SDR family oxidoreductase [Acetobacter cerevisiae]MCP1256838.1 SDR family oxidoreductase [Acetobacter cerevisiae]
MSGKQKKVLVTGGGGFVGSHLCKALLEKGQRVICMDNYYTGSEKNISHLLSDENFKVINHNIIDSFDLEVDEIYNLACPASPPHYQKDPIYTLKTSVWGMLNVLENARRYGAKVLQASTSEVYGDPTLSPQSESYRGNVNTMGPRACYDEGKRVAETLCYDYNKSYDVEVKVVRIFNTYGPQMHPEDGRVVSNFILQALQNKPITIYGDGSQTRAFCYVSDLVDGFIRFMDTERKVTGPLNLGNPREMTIKQLADAVIELTNSASTVEYLPLPVDDPLQRCPDISFAENLLGWTPQVILEDGIKNTIEYFSNVSKS